MLAHMYPRFTLRRSSKLLWSELLVFAVMLTASRAALAQSSPEKDLSNQFQVRVEKLSIEGLSGSKLVLGVALAATSTRDLTVDRVVFSGLRINGVPIAAAPFEHRLKLRRDSSVDLPQPLLVTIDLRDVSSLTPLRRAIAEGRATVEGVASVRVPLSALAALLRLSRHAEVSTQLHQQVEVSVPGGALASVALVKLLDVAQSGLDLLQLK